MVTIGARAHSLDQTEQVGKMGYPFAEINLDNPKKMEDRLNRLLELKQRFSLHYLAHFPNEGDPTDIDNLKTVFVPKVKKLIEFSPLLGIKKGTIHFWMDKRWATEKIIAEKIKMLAELVAHAGKHNMILCLENLTSGYESFKYYFEQIPDLRMTMDIGHGQLLAKENTSFGLMQHVFDKIDHVHVHDNLGGSGVQDDLHLALGEGIVDYPKIFSILKQKGYNSTMTMEVQPAAMAKTHMAIVEHIG